ncbi:MAG TPA: hypothetical protein VFK73_07075 [Paludibacter sp.]|nr:hypothetical protein [Paludibacter sp.]
MDNTIILLVSAIASFGVAVSLIIYFVRQKYKISDEKINVTIDMAGVITKLIQNILKDYNIPEEKSGIYFELLSENLDFIKSLIKDKNKGEQVNTALELLKGVAKARKLELTAKDFEQIKNILGLIYDILGNYLNVYSQNNTKGL